MGFLDLELLLEEAERVDAVLRALELEAVEGIALRQADLAADHLVLGLGVAVDLDALDIGRCAAAMWKLIPIVSVSLSRCELGFTSVKAYPNRPVDLAQIVDRDPRPAWRCTIRPYASAAWRPGACCRSRGCRCRWSPRRNL